MSVGQRITNDLLRTLASDDPMFKEYKRFLVGRARASFRDGTSASQTIKIVQRNQCATDYGRDKHSS